jgi:hypothetical protein
MSNFKYYIMKTIKTILMIAIFSMVTISCTDLISDDDLMENPDTEMIKTFGDPVPDPDPTPDPDPDAPDTGNEGDDTTGDGSGKGN